MSSDPARRAAEKIREIVEAMFQSIRDCEEDDFASIIADKYADVDELVQAARHVLHYSLAVEAIAERGQDSSDVEKALVQHVFRAIAKMDRPSILDSIAPTIQVGESAQASEEEG